MTTEKKLRQLLLDFGYIVDGEYIIIIIHRRRGRSGYIRDRVWGRCRSVFDAADQLRPIIKDDEFSERHTRITTP